MQIVPNLRIGGAQRVAVTLCNELVAQGHEVVLVALGEGGPLEDALRKSPALTVHRLRMRRHSLLAFPLFVVSVIRIVGRLRALMRKHRVDAVQSHMGEANLLGTLAAWLAAVPRRFPTFHSLVFVARGGADDRRNRLARRTLRAFGRIATRFVAISEAVREKVIESTGVAPERVVTVRNGIELPPPADPALRERRRAELGLSDGDPVAICVGRLSPAKGHPHLLRALALLQGEFPRLTCLLIGDGEERAALESLARELGVADRVRFLGFRSDVAEWLALGDVFVLPSNWEGLPIALLEAMAAGLPAVATRVAGSVEVIRDGNGLLVPPQDPPALAAALRSLLTDRAAAARMAARGQADVRAHFGIAAVCARYVELYRGGSDGGDAPARSDS
jgi:glycosyltransferase involved in cell wall biosynthesis